MRWYNLIILQQFCGTVGLWKHRRLGKPASESWALWSQIPSIYQRVESQMASGRDLWLKGNHLICFLTFKLSSLSGIPESHKRDALLGKGLPVPSVSCWQNPAGWVLGGHYPLLWTTSTNISVFLDHSRVTTYTHSHILIHTYSYTTLQVLHMRSYFFLYLLLMIMSFVLQMGMTSY